MSGAIRSTATDPAKLGSVAFPYAPGQDIYRSIAITPDGQGYMILLANGDISKWGTAATGPAAWIGSPVFDGDLALAQHKAGKQCTIPILYMSGHEAFEFSDDQRTALKQYVLDGGTFLGDACCGRPEFADDHRQSLKAAKHTARKSIPG